MFYSKKYYLKLLMININGGGRFFYGNVIIYELKNAIFL